MSDTVVPMLSIPQPHASLLASGGVRDMALGLDPEFVGWVAIRSGDDSETEFIDDDHPDFLRLFAPIPPSDDDSREYREPFQGYAPTFRQTWDEEARGSCGFPLGCVLALVRVMGYSDVAKIHCIGPVVVLPRPVPTDNLSTWDVPSGVAVRMPS